MYTTSYSVNAISFVIWSFSQQAMLAAYNSLSAEGKKEFETASGASYYPCMSAVKMSAVVTRFAASYLPDGAFTNAILR